MELVHLNRGSAPAAGILFVQSRQRTLIGVGRLSVTERSDRIETTAIIGGMTAQDGAACPVLDVLIHGCKHVPCPIIEPAKVRHTAVSAGNH